MMLAKNFEIGDLVWAKMKSFPPWPGQIVAPPAKAKPRKGFHYVLFFGSEDHAWQKDETINHHSESMIPPATKKKSALLQSAIDDIIKLSKDRPLKVDRSVGNSVFSASPKAKSPKAEKTKKSPKSKINRRRLSSSQMGRSPKMGRFHEESSPRDLELSNWNLPPRFGEILSESLMEANASDFKHVTPTAKRIGFLGLGTMGQGIVKNLLESGHNVTVWNRTHGKYLRSLRAGAVISDNPADVVKASDIIFCCVSDPNAVKALVFGHDGVLEGLEESAQQEGGRREPKGYVEMTSIDFQTAAEISEAIEIKGGTYLEASLVGSKEHAEDGNLLILASGKRELFEECKTCFHAISEVAYFLGSEPGQSSKFSLVISTLMGTTFAAMAEALALAERTKVSQYDFLKVLELKGFSCREIINRAKSIIAHDFGEVSTALKHQQKDMHLTLLMSEVCSQLMPVTTSANELYKHAKLLGYGDHDIAAVFYGAKY